MPRPPVVVNISRQRRATNMGAASVVSGMSTPKKVLIGGGLLLLTMSLFGRSNDSEGEMDSLWFGPNKASDERINDFLARVPARAAAAAPTIVRIAREQQVHPALIYGIGDWESGHTWNPSMVVGDAGGKAYSPFAINDLFHQAWLSKGLWPDLYQAGTYAISKVLKPGYQQAIHDGWNGRWADDIAVASYNGGYGGAVKGAKEGNPQKYTYPKGNGVYVDNIYNGIRAIGYTF